MNRQFSVRVYGIYRHSEKGILALQEEISGGRYLKLPGGGVEWGEAIPEALNRELEEELTGEWRVKDQLHVTEQFVHSRFVEGVQVIAVYYAIEHQGGGISCTLSKGEICWIPFSQVHRFSFPTDREVLMKLL